MIDYSFGFSINFRGQRKLWKLCYAVSKDILVPCEFFEIMLSYFEKFICEAWKPTRIENKTKLKLEEEDWKEFKKHVGK